MPQLQCGETSVGVVTEATCVRLELTDPLPEPTEAIACDITAAATLTAKVSDADSPLLSVAITLRLRDVAEVGAVPLKVSVVPLNFNHVGSAVPLAFVAA